MAKAFTILVPLVVGTSLAIPGTAFAGAVAKPRPAWTTSKLKGTPEPPEPYRIVPAYPDLRFDKPTSIEEMPGLNRLMVSEIGGRILSFPKNRDVSNADMILELDGVTLFHATVHPKFQQNRFVFVCYTRDGVTYVSRFTLSEISPPRADQTSEQVVITWPAGGHNAGCLRFGRDGYLYISTGDGSGPNPPDGLTAGQDVSNLFGAVLRIDADQSSGTAAYAVPGDNPFVDLENARPEIWAYGLRNPWKFGIDPKSGNIFAADNGWESWEMVHRIVRGGNCGWPIMEGRAVLRSEVKAGPTPIRPPVKDHSHTEANSVIGGPVYRGAALPQLDGTFIYGDYITGTIWGLKLNDDDSYSHTTLVDTDQRITSFAQGSRGELYVLDYDFTGQIYELRPSGLKDTSAEFPRRLSETGLFASLDDMTPAPGVVAYDVIVDRWMDGADAQRWAAIPGMDMIRFANDEDSSTEYPDGTVFVKHLTLPRGEGQPPLRLETQLLHFENGRWNPYSYLWDETGTDAHLVDSIGADRPIRLSGGNTDMQRTWHVSAVNECRLCHNAGSGFVLGFVPHQLGRLGPRTSSDQLSILTDMRAIAAPSSATANGRLQLVDPRDQSQPLDDRARSYLHTNCSSCHHPGGNAIVSFFLRRDLPFDRLNTNKGTGIGTFGMRHAKIIVPGDPYRSVLMYRMSKLGYARMPYIGSRVVDSAGVALIDEWIRSLSVDASEQDSAPTRDDSAESTALRRLSKDSSSSRSEREAAVQTLVKSSEGALALVARMHAGSLSESDFHAAVSAGYGTPGSDVRGLFETFVPEAKRRATLGPKPDPQSILTLRGDSQRGQLIFFSDAARCKTCHDVRDPAKSTGPTLVEIFKKYPRESELLQHVLQPSLKIDEKFAAWLVVTNEGRATAGLLVEQTPEYVVLKSAEGKLIRIARGDIDELEKSNRSLMPDRILSDLTAQEAADLFAYLRSISSGRSGVQ